MDTLDVLVLTDFLTCNIKYVLVEDILSLREAVSTKTALASIGDSLSLTDHLSVVKFVNLRITDTLNLSDIATPRVVFGVATDYLQFIDSAKRNPGGSDSLIFTDSLSAIMTKGTGTPDFLRFIDFVTVTQVHATQVFDSLGLFDAASAYIEGKPWRVNANFVEATTIEFNNLRGFILILPKPKFGDVETFTLKRINRLSRGNDLITAKIDGWRDTSLIRFEWDYLHKTDWEKLKELVRLSVGYPVATNGVYGNLMRVLFLKPEVEFVQLGRENFQVTLDMQILNGHEPYLRYYDADNQ